jgi:hypothetical protein
MINRAPKREPSHLDSFVVEPSKWSEDALSSLADAGYRRGGARRELITLMGEQQCALSALELEAALATGGRRVSRAAIIITSSASNADESSQSPTKDSSAPSRASQNAFPSRSPSMRCCCGARAQTAPPDASIRQGIPGTRQTNAADPVPWDRKKSVISCALIRH